MMDHGYKVDEGKRCNATTKKARPCTMFALAGIELCALHSGLARAKTAANFGSASAFEVYKRGLVAPRKR